MKKYCYWLDSTNMFPRLADDPCKYIIPAATADNAWQLWVAAVLYLATAFFAIFEAARAVNSRGLKSYRFSFLTFSFLFALLRGVLTTYYIPVWQDYPFLLVRYLQCFPFFCPAPSQ